MTERRTISRLRVDVRGDLEEQQPNGGWDEVTAKYQEPIIEARQMSIESIVSLAILGAVITITILDRLIK